MHMDAFQTLADPARRRIIQALQKGERQVGDIVEQAGIHQSGVSRHLRILHEAGFVSMRPDRQLRLYSGRGLSESLTRGSPSTAAFGRRASTALEPRLRDNGAAVAGNGKSVCERKE